MGRRNGGSGGGLPTPTAPGGLCRPCEVTTGSRQSSKDVGECPRRLNEETLGGEGRCGGAITGENEYLTYVQVFASGVIG